MKKLVFLFFLALMFFALAVVGYAEEQPVEITYITPDLTASVGDEVTLECTAAEVPDGISVRYIWYKSLSLEDVGEPITAASTDSGYTVDTMFPGNFYYYCVVYNIDNNTGDFVYKRSDTVTVTIEGEPDIERPVILEDIDKVNSVFLGGVLLLEIKCEIPDDPVVLQYQWYAKDSQGVFNKISGATESIYSVPTENLGRFEYLCIVSACYGEFYKNTQSEIAVVNVENHEHEYGEWELVSEPTCSKFGERQRLCVCGATEIEKIEKLEHSFGEWKVTVEPTYSDSGEEERICSLCNEKEIRKIEKLTGEETTYISETTEREDVTSDDETSGEDTSTEEVTTSVPDETTGGPEIPSETDGKQFPWWTVIIIFGIVSTLGFGGAAFWFIRKSSILIKKEKNTAEDKKQEIKAEKVNKRSNNRRS